MRLLCENGAEPDAVVRAEGEVGVEASSGTEVAAGTEATVVKVRMLKQLRHGLRKQLSRKMARQRAAGKAFGAYDVYLAHKMGVAKDAVVPIIVSSVHWCSNPRP